MEQLYGLRIVVCPFSYCHIQSYLLAFTQEVRTWLHVPSVQAEYDYLLHRMSLIYRRQTFFYTIFDRWTQSIIGALEIRGKEYPGQLYTWLRPDYWGKGYFRESFDLIKRCYFAHTDALYVTARVDIQNKQSYKSLKKVGFTDYAFVQGAYAPQFELLYINSLH